VITVPLTVRCFVATGTAAALMGCSSSSSGNDAEDAQPTTAPSTSAAPVVDPGRQAYLDAVNALCRALLPKVVEATDGGSTDVPAATWVKTWPAHRALLDGFDHDLAAITVPPAAKDSAKVMTTYVAWATRIDDRRIEAAKKGEKAWQEELAAEVGIESDPALQALGAAGFDESCQAR
jgi:hypothetical protein